VWLFSPGAAPPRKAILQLIREGNSNSDPPVQGKERKEEEDRRRREEEEEKGSIRAL